MGRQNDERPKMLLDNAYGSKKVYEWIEESTVNGTFDVVTGYFTVGALTWLSDKLNEKISNFQMVLGDIADRAKADFCPLNLLNEEISLDSALSLAACAKRAVAFLKQDKVLVKTLEPNFCHAKLYLHNTANAKDTFFISGSSNLTEAGIGQRNIGNNAELNIVESGMNPQYKELKEWFDNLWKNSAKEDKTVVHQGGKEVKVNFKKYLITEISKIFKIYTPDDIYLKILTEMDLCADTEIVDKSLRNSKIYNALYDFQKAGVVNLVRMLNENNGAILADAVGLGKTWTALAVIKFYQKNGYDTVVICPKKLDYNWRKWTKKFQSKFQADGFDYLIRFHTDLEEARMKKKAKMDTDDVFFTSDNPRLFVIDESHAMRNENGSRYRFLLENVLKKNENAKILMLSATPINNDFLDVRNQFNLIPQIPHMEKINKLFRSAQKKLEKWGEEENPAIVDLVKRLQVGEDGNIIDIIDKYVVARTRNVIKHSVREHSLNFPKWGKPENLYITPNCVKGCDSFESLLSLLPGRFSAYMPAVYAEMTSGDAMKNESRRDMSLVGMMRTMLVKRLESSWHSFYKTIGKILNYHKEVLDKVTKYQNFESGEFDEDELAELFEDSEYSFELDRKREIKIGDIKNKDVFKADLVADTKKLQHLYDKLTEFHNNFTIKQDGKLQKLIEIIKDKPKALVFTAFTDTAEYLYQHVKKLGSVCLVTGNTKDEEIKDTLRRFAPLATFKDSEQTEANKAEYEKNKRNEVKILISTDILSEGQNMQDCGFVVNYDIHWNPVRVIQRLGRIDRLGSEHKKINYANFWPTANINEYLRLQSRIERKMAGMKLVGTETPNITGNVENMNEDKTLEQKQIEKNLKLMEHNIDDIEEKTFSLSNLTFGHFRQDLSIESAKKYKSIPNGVFSGFLDGQNGLVALIKNKKDYDLRLIFIDMQGEHILKNKIDILNLLQRNRYNERVVSSKIDSCDKAELEKLYSALRIGLSNQVSYDENEQLDLLKTASQLTRFTNIQNTAVVEKEDPRMWDLLCWCAVSREP